MKVKIATNFKIYFPLWYALRLLYAIIKNIL